VIKDDETSTPKGNDERDETDKDAAFEIMFAA